MTTAQNAVLNVLRERKEPLRPGEIAELAGLDAKEVDKAIKALKTTGEVYSPKRCYYAVQE